MEHIWLKLEKNFKRSKKKNKAFNFQPRIIDTS